VVWEPVRRHLGIPDVLFPASGVIVELDGPRFHRTAAQRARDRGLDRARGIAGYLPLRFDYWDLTERPADVIAEIRAAIAARG
jgi:very-short-patch-repair endonuclease